MKLPPACGQIAALCLLLGAFPLLAQQSRPPLQGGVTEEQVNPQYQTTAENEIHISQLVADIIRLVGTITGSQHGGAPPGSRFNEAVTEFGKYKRSAKYGSIANQYAPCVAKVLAAAPHVLKAYDIAQELARAGPNQRKQVQDNYDRETALATDLLTAASDCLDNTPAENNIYRQTRRGNPPGNNPRPPPQQAGVDNGTSYYPGVPDQPLRSPCQPDGPGGYDFCNNPGPPPLGCNCSKKATQPPPINRPPAKPPDKADPIEYLKGVLRGLQDCGKSVGDLLTAAECYFQADYVGMAKALGLEPGQSVVLRTIAQELGTPVLGASPFEAGRTAGRRICQYALIPAAARLPKTLRGLKAQAGTRFNPIEGAAVVENSSQLAGQFVKTPMGTMKFGKLLGDPAKLGAMGNVYELPTQPGQVVKVSNTNPESTASFTRQLEGYNELEKAGIPTPRIYRDFISEVEGQPSFLLMEDVRSKFPGATFFDNVSSDAGRASAVEQLYDDMGRNGLVWPDGHPGNIAFAKVDGKLQAIVVDQDMIFQAKEWSTFEFLQRNQGANLGIVQRLVKLFDDPLGTRLRYQDPLKSVPAMTSLYKARYIIMKQ